jgi:hypothetical protein
MHRMSVSTTTVLFVLVAFVAPALAGAPMMVKAKQAGYPAQNCQYCHVSKLPKKEDFKPEDLNERGKWLADQKQKQSAKEVNVEWLKDYPGGK